MPGNTLGPGSGIPGSPQTVGDFTIAGVATRLITTSPTDADWGPTPPPLGTFVGEGDANGVILWMRVGVGVWVVVGSGAP